MAELILCGFLSIFFSVMLFTGWFTTNVFLGDESVRTYPAVILIVIIICLVLHCIHLYKALPDEEKNKNILDIFMLRERNTQKFLVSIILTIAYFFALDTFGFLLLTPFITLYYIMILGEHKKKWWKALLIALLMVGAVYCVFVYGLKIRMPRGIGVFRDFSLAVEFLFG